MTVTTPWVTTPINFANSVDRRLLESDAPTGTPMQNMLERSGMVNVENSSVGFVELNQVDLKVVSAK